jgi:predicted nucleic acid-binding protein
MKKVLFDISVVLDLLNRPPWAANMAVLWDAHRTGQIEAVVAAFSLPTIFYIVRRQSDLATARQAVQVCLDTLSIAPVDQPALIAAQAMPGADFEDNLQIACAVQVGADLIVTRDPHGFAHSPLAVLPPAALVAQLAPPSGP